MRKLAILVLLVISGLFLISCAHVKKENAPPLAAQVKNEIAVQDEGLGNARLAPDFKLADLSGKFYTLSEYKGKQPVLL
ncbi:MAG: peroxiredoxin, partial [Candidatus Omnitrophota bacterium]